MPQQVLKAQGPDGKVVTFEWSGAEDPTDQELDEIFAEAAKSEPQGLMEKIKGMDVTEAGLAAAKKFSSGLLGMGQMALTQPLQIGAEVGRDLGVKAATGQLQDPKILKQLSPVQPGEGSFSEKVGNVVGDVGALMLPMAGGPIRGFMGKAAGGAAKGSQKALGGAFGRTLMEAPSKFEKPAGAVLGGSIEVPAVKAAARGFSPQTSSSTAPSQAASVAQAPKYPIGQATRFAKKPLTDAKAQEKGLETIQKAYQQVKKVERGKRSEGQQKLYNEVGKLLALSKKSLGDNVPSGKISDPNTFLEMLRRVGKSEKGAAQIKLLLPLAGAAIGGPLIDPEDPLKGILLGAGAGLAATKAGSALKSFPGLRREAFLLGGAIPKNIATGTGSIARAALEGTGKSRIAPIKEALRIPTNIKEFTAGRTKPTMQSMGSVQQRTPTKFGWAPSRVISGVDTSFTKMLERAGLPKAEIERALLTKDNQNLKKLLMNAVSGAPSEVKKLASQAIDFTIPFQRTPSNVVSEGFGEVGGLAKRGQKVRNTITAASPLAGDLLARWVNEKGGNKKQRLAIASIITAAFGPSSALVAAGAAPHLGFQQSLGGISPIPEWSFNPEKIHGLPIDVEKGKVKPATPGFLKWWSRLAGKEK